jgi:ketosteroid isomerase-like protein
MDSAVEIVRDFYAALGRGDAQSVFNLLHSELEWTEAEGFPYYGGTWRHPEDVLEKLLVPIARDWENFMATADDFIVEGDRVVSLGFYSGVAKMTKKNMRAAFAHVWRIRDGKLARFDMYTDTYLVRQAIEN